MVDEFMKKYLENKELGKMYMYDGITTSAQAIHNDFRTPIEKYYGNPGKRLALDTKGNWKIAVGAGLIPDFVTEPRFMDEEEFSRAMLELGVPEELLNEYYTTESYLRPGD
jgi:hypothetical protein